MPDGPIGERIAEYRKRRGLTQEELAGLVGISLSMMKKIESGRRPVTRFSQLVNLAQALRVRDLRELTGVPYSLMPDQRAAPPAADHLRTAMMTRAQAGSSPVDIDRLAADIEHAWTTWQSPSSFRYQAVGHRLPDLVASAELALRGTADRRRVLRLASSLYQLVRTWTKRVGEHELSLVAADRAVTCALDADDPELAGAAAWNLAMILSAQGRTDEATRVVHRALEDRAASTISGPAGLAVLGGLHLMGATVAARDDRESETTRMLDQARGLARRTGETNHHRLVFGPLNVELHRVSTAVELGRTQQALDLIERMDVTGSQAVERRITFYLEATRCYTRQRNDVAAVHMIGRIRRESPEELTFSAPVRATLRELRNRSKPALASELRPLLAVANLDD